MTSELWQSGAVTYLHDHSLYMCVKSETVYKPWIPFQIFEVSIRLNRLNSYHPRFFSPSRFFFVNKEATIMSDLKATVAETTNGFHVEGYEKIEYDFTFLDGVFELSSLQLAKLYEKWGRCLAIMDKNIYELYGQQMQKYFDHHGIELKIHQTMIGEKAKSLDTFTNIVDSMTDFGIIRKEPVLVVVCFVRNNVNNSY